MNWYAGLDANSFMFPVKHSTYHGVTLGSETIQEMQHSHVQCLNRLRLKERMKEHFVTDLTIED